MIGNIALIALWFFVWLLLSWPPDRQHLFIGLPVAAFVYFMTRDLFRKRIDLLKSPKRYLWFFVYIAVFLWEVLKANIDVALRVIHPDLPIRPGTVKVRVGLTSDTALTFLANSVTLTPGTTTVDIDKDKGVFYIHCIYMRDGYESEFTRLPVVEKFERILRRVFE